MMIYETLHTSGAHAQCIIDQLSNFSNNASLFRCKICTQYYDRMNNPSVIIDEEFLFSEYERIIDILDGKSTYFDDEHMSRMDHIGPTVLDKMFPIQLLDHLGKWECLTKEDHENVSVVAKTKSVITGSRMLIEKLRLSRKRDWYEYTLRALTDSSQEMVAEQLDSKSKTKLQYYSVFLRIKIFFLFWVV